MQGINSTIDLMIPSLLKFAKALTMDKNKGLELVCSAYSVFLAKEIDIITSIKNKNTYKKANALDKNDKRKIKISFFKEIFYLAKKSGQLSNFSNLSSLQEGPRSAYQLSFYELPLEHRAILYLEYSFMAKKSEIMSILELDGKNYIECKVNAKYKLLRANQEVKNDKVFNCTN